LFGREFWERVVDFHGLAEEGVISLADLDLITWCETADEAWDAVCKHYECTDEQRAGVSVAAA
jgi:predicted Rossmann-fold nucleotide-binding protein